jgi:hypothetical protein
MLLSEFRRREVDRFFSHLQETGMCASSSISGLDLQSFGAGRRKGLGACGWGAVLGIGCVTARVLLGCRMYGRLSIPATEPPVIAFPIKCA